MDPKEKKLKKDDDLKNESVDNDLTLPGLGDDFEDDFLPGMFEDDDFMLGDDITPLSDDDDFLPGLEDEEGNDEVLPGIEDEEEIVEEIVEEDDDGLLPGLEDEEVVEEIVEEDDGLLPGLEDEEIIEEDELDSLEEVSEDEAIEELDEDEEYEIIEIEEGEELPEGEEYEIIEEIVEKPVETAEEVTEEIAEDDEYEIVEIEEGEELPDDEEYEIIEEIVEEVEEAAEETEEAVEEIEETAEETEEAVEEIEEAAEETEETTEEVEEVAEETEEAVEEIEEAAEETEETTEEVEEVAEETEEAVEEIDDSDKVDEILASDTSDELAEEVGEVEDVEEVAEEVVEGESETEEDDDSYYYYSDEEEEEEEEEDDEEEEEPEESIYPDELVDIELECIYIGLLFNNPKAMSRFYFVYDDCRFSDDELMNLYKIVLFRDGEQYAPAIAKDKFQLPRETPNTYELKLKVRKIAAAKEYNLEQVYMKLKKLFILKKNYLTAPTSAIQEKILEIQNYELYADMTVEEVESALEQITVTTGLSQGRLNDDVTNFLLAGDNELSNGISIPFNILSTVFKGLRKGETMCYAMPSNSGKSRFTINLAAYISFIHRQKVLIISNEMSEEKMKLCMITTILNNPEIQELHGQKIMVSEGELLELKFRPDKGKRVKCDENGYILRKDDETQEEYVGRLEKNSSVFRQTLKVTEWVNTQLNNSIFFIHITEHTNDDLKKIIMNFYYKEGIQYMFYDTLKADTANIGSSDEVKKTATILSNLAQKFKIFIASSMQLLESNTLPVNLTINDMSASKTAKEVLDTLCLIKQISRQSLHKYEYADTDQFDKCYEIDVPKDTDVRFYACVVDKNRAGAKPTVLFRLNLAYNRWEELGHLRLKQTEIQED